LLFKFVYFSVVLLSFIKCARTNFQLLILLIASATTRFDSHHMPVSLGTKCWRKSDENAGDDCRMCSV